MRNVVICVAALMVAGCSVTLPVAGSMEDGDETFTGTTTGYSDGSGTLTVVSNKGLSCTGNWSYVVRPTYGRGIFRCSNGQSGPFEFNGAGQHGTGIGRLGTRRFTFTYG